MADGIPTTLAYEPASNRLDTLGATDVLLDATGNTLNQGNWSYTYTPHHRLRTATESATLKASFAYNGLGQRLTKVDETATAGTTGRHFLYSRNGELLVETDQDGNILLEYLYLDGQLLAVYSPDDDQDGTPNSQEAEAGTLPVGPDADGDGLSNLAEWFQHGTDSTNPDSDGDGVFDGMEITDGTDPNNAASVSGNGDVDGNGETNLGDLVLLYQMITGVRIPTPEEQTRGDMNRDGELNAADVLLLQKQLLQSWLGGIPLTETLDWLRSLVPPAQAVPANHGVLYYVHNDPLGTPQVLTDETGATVWSASYDPFGKAIIDKDPDHNGITVTFNPRFPGQYHDVKTGLYYNINRYYDPQTGRYLTADPLGISAGLDLYAYANGNPLKFIDPLGLDEWVGVLGSGGAAFLLAGGNVSVGGLRNVRTGENCVVQISCLRVGFGFLVSGGAKFTGSVFAPRCGKDLEGLSFELSGDLIAPGAGGLGGSIGGGSGLGGTISGKPEGGAGFFLGVDICKLKVIGCSNTPCDCDS